jgi:tetratricopeptide (TPR) repeat protein
VLQLLGQRLGVSGEFLAQGRGSGSAELDTLAEAEFALRLDDAELAERRFVEVLDAAEDAKTKARALEGLGQLAFRRGDPARTVTLLEESLELSHQQVTDRPKLAETLGRACAMLGDLESSIEIFDACLRQAERRRDRIEASRFGVLLGNALIDAADFARAEQLLGRTLELAEEVRDPVLRARLYWLESRLHAEQDDPERAAEYARQALAIVQLTEDRSYTARAHQLLAHIELTPVEHAQYRLEEARALAATGRPEEAAAVAMQVSGVVANANVEDAGRTYTLLADLFAELGDGARAGELSELAADLLERNPNRYLVRVYRRHAELLESQGQTGEAMELLKRAVAVGEADRVRFRRPRLVARAAAGA